MNIIYIIFRLLTNSQLFKISLGLFLQTNVKAEGVLLHVWSCFPLR